MIMRNVATSLFKLQKTLTETITIGGKKVEFIEESIFGHKYQTVLQGELVNLYFDEPLRIDTQNIICSRLKEKEIFVLEQIKGTIRPKIIEKKNRYEGEKSWKFC